MIFAVNFTGRLRNAIGISYPISTHCYGENEEAAILDLYERYDHVQNLRIEPRPVMKVGECSPGDRIYRVEDTRLIGDRQPHESFYTVEPHNEIVCSGTYAGHVCCRNGAGVLVPVAAELECIIAREPVTYWQRLALPESQD
jgi:hypothetical protein